MQALDGEYAGNLSSASPSPQKGVNATASKFEIALQNASHNVTGETRANVSGDQLQVAAQPVTTESPPIIARNSSRDPRDFREIGDRLSKKKSDLVEIKKKLNTLVR